MSTLLILLPYLLALLGVFARVYIPYLSKKLNAEGPINWTWREAAVPGLTGFGSYLVILASGVLVGATWQVALGIGLTAAVFNWGIADISKVMSKLLPTAFAIAKEVFANYGKE